MSFSSDPALLANQLPISVEIPKEWERFIPIMELLYKRIANAVNTKEGGLYNLVETASFIQYFTAGVPNLFRSGYRMTVNFGSLPNAGTKSVPHGIGFISTFRVTRIYSASTDPVNLFYIPIPYASPTDSDNIEIDLDGMNVNITTGSDRTNFTDTTVVIEYTKTQ